MPTPDLPKVEAAIIQLTNAFRADEKRGTVQAAPALRKAAESYAQFLAARGLFSHTADGRQPGDRAKAAGYEYCIVSENLASNLDSRGFETRQLAHDVVEGWKGSPGHRKNMVEPNVTEIGVAVAKAAGEEKYISVQLFGRPISHRYEFRVSNGSELAVSYTFVSRPYVVEPRRIITHTECVPGTLTFVSAGNWLSKQALQATFATKPGLNVLIEPDGRSSGLQIRALPVELPKVPKAPETAASAKR